MISFLSTLGLVPGWPSWTSLFSARRRVKKLTGLDPKQIRKVNERLKSKILPAPLDALEILHRDVGLLGQLLLGHSSLDPQLSYTTAHVALDLPCLLTHPRTVGQEQVSKKEP